MAKACEGPKWPVDANAAVFLVVLCLFFSVLHYQVLHHLTISHDRVTTKKIPNLPLRFRSDGTFKILQVADMHFGNGITTSCRDVSRSQFKHCSDLNTTSYVRRLIEAEKPDFLAFTGDNIFGSSASDAAESLIRAFRPATESGVPWAAILGNHDQESTMTRQELMSFISLMDYSVSQTHPSVQDPYFPGKELLLSNIDGFGNYDLTVRGAFGSQLVNSSVLHLFFLDSGDRATVEGKRTYGWIKPSQLRWLHTVSQELQDKNQVINDPYKDVNIPPALVFFHIPIPEVWHLYHQKIVGQFQEAVACSSVNSGVLETLLSTKMVKAVFMGHDHKNDFCGNLRGIQFCYGGGAGYHGYGKQGWPRRARVILAELSKGEKSWMGVGRIRTWKRLDDEMLSKIDEQIKCCDFVQI
ncbi:hypothetical protein V2J09_015498 [Rumex salicifolius]